jgi:FMN reductase
VEDAVDQVTGADLLLVASPTYKGTYTGLLKVFLDRLDYQALSSVTALPMLVMRVPQHALAVDVHLRPLLLELGAAVPGPGLAFLESDLGQPDGVLGPWAARVADALGRAGSPALTR